MPTRYSRHYYDLYKLATSHVRDSALLATSLLDEVVEFKQRFYPSKWARYDRAKPGSFQLIPSSETYLKSLRTDYEQMQVMLFGTRPSLDEILEELKTLEKQINSVA
jgi:hypothetical protein